MEEQENPCNKLEVSEYESAALAHKSDRGFGDYKKYLRINEEDLIGKDVLDLGSGPESRFAQEAEKNLPNTKVTSLDFSFEGAEQVGSKPQKVRGLFTQLPFADDSFEVVISAFAMPFYLHNQEQISNAIREVIRVLRKGGKAHLGPVIYTDVVDKDPNKDTWDTHVQHAYEEAKKLCEESLKKLEGEIEFEFKPPIVHQPRNIYKDVKIDPGVLVITKK